MTARVISLTMPTHDRSLARRGFLLLTLLLLGWSLLPAQTRVCGTMDYLEHQLEANPALRYRMQQIERQTEENIKGAAARMQGKIVIPVVVHVVYNQGPENISDAQILSQLRVLNEDFRRRNPDQTETIEAWRPVAADTRISFQLANRDPNGQPTNGITRTRTSKSEFLVQNNGVKYSAMGGVDAWPTDQYLNIWVCNLAMGVLGYSQFPGGPRETDGVVIGYKFFGTTGTVRPPFNGGRTCTHEVGHWLNLRHIWGDGPCSIDDHVADTPPADRPTQGCPNFRNACGHPVMTSNYMDYTDDACMNLFTFGQADRMQSLFLPGGARASLRNSPGLVPVGPPPAEQVLASMTVEAVSPSRVRLYWEPVAGAESYNVRFRRVGQDSWKRRNFGTPSVNTSGLQPCTEYEYQVEPVLGGIGAGFSASRSFRTEGCPTQVAVPGGNDASLAPTELIAQPAAKGRAILRWEPVAGATGYRVQYKAAGSRRVGSTTVQSNQLEVAGLEEGKRYFWRVRADFEGESGPFSVIHEFYASSHMANLRVGPFLRAPDQVTREEWALPVMLDLETSVVFSAEIVDEFGAEVQTYPPRPVPARDWFKVPLQGLSPGRYRLILQDETGFTYEHDFQLN